MIDKFMLVKLWYLEKKTENSEYIAIVKMLHNQSILFGKNLALSKIKRAKLISSLHGIWVVFFFICTFIPIICKTYLKTLCHTLTLMLT